MGKSLIIVESPTKAKTITKYLGRGYTVMASVGHVKDLPTSKLGVDLENDFEPQYVTIKGKSKVLAEIKKKAEEADKVFLAPDPDREGEAIAWHIEQELLGKSKKKRKDGKIFRVLFNEITERAIKQALQSPGDIDMNLVNAQQARRVLDRIVGYQGSQLLWNKVRRGLSMGRVQSVAMRLICEREAEREAFRSEEYWSITALVAGINPPAFEAKLHNINGEEASIQNAEQAGRIVAEIQGKTFVGQSIERREKKRNPVAPFITSRLQQEASRKLHFSPKKTMTLAQQLYEGIEIGSEGPTGLITYMRTDSPRVSLEATEDARAVIRERFGMEYLPAAPNVYKTQKAAQEAHEAIRPSVQPQSGRHGAALQGGGGAAPAASLLGVLRSPRRHRQRGWRPHPSAPAGPRHAGGHPGRGGGGARGDAIMNDWLTALARLQATGESACLVTVAATQGSTPREAGARMVVSLQGPVGTIGGGQLEHQALAIARDMLATDAPPRQERFPLSLRLEFLLPYWKSTGRAPS